MTPADVISDNLRVTFTVGEWADILQDVKNPELAAKLETHLRTHINQKVDRFRDHIMAEILNDGSEDETQDIDRPQIEAVALEEEPQLKIASPGLQWYDSAAMGAVCLLFLLFVRISLI